MKLPKGSRRGSLAYSLRPQHGDFEKVLAFLFEETESNNVGWLIDDEFIAEMNAKNEEFMAKFQRILGVKLPRVRVILSFGQMPKTFS